MVLYCATARVPQCMGSQISMENEQNPIHQHNKNTVYNNKLNSKLVGSVPSLMDYQWQCGCDHILGTFTAHTCTVFTQARTTKANRLVLCHACFAVPNATIASLCDVLRLFCNHKVSSCKLFGTLPYLFCSNELNCNRFLFYSLPCSR